jgi:alkaline phosphatase D
MYKSRFLEFLMFLAFFFFASHVSAEPYKILFGSCLHQDKPLNILDQIYSEKPDAFIFLGDNVYGDTEAETMDALKQAYATADKFLNRERLGEIHAIWDDHDYGRNDGGGDYPLKKQSEALFLDFWKVPINDVRRQRDGIYYSTITQIGDVTLQMIFLDTRFFRSQLKKYPINFLSRFSQYLQTQDTQDIEATLLGKEQWVWLYKQLAKSADIRIIASSIQVLASNHRWEKWSNFPAERQELLSAIKNRNGGDILLISGDRHFSALYEMPGASINSENSLLEFTSSSLNNNWKGAKETDALMVEEPFGRLGSYGKITLYPKNRALQIDLVDENGNTIYYQNRQF